MNQQERALERLATLSGQERQIVVLMAGGLTVQEVAKAMGISNRTAIYYKRCAYAKIGINKATQAAVICTLAGLVTDWREAA